MAQTPVELDVSELSYEEAYAALEKTLQALEAGELPLDQALALYERGSALAQRCAVQLDEAELRVRQWQGGEQTAPFTEWAKE